MKTKVLLNIALTFQCLTLHAVSEPTFLLDWFWYGT
jgi:hypothetical protein